MSSDWRELCLREQFTVDGDDVIVAFANDRSHRVRVRELDAAFEVHATVARAKALNPVADTPLRIWRLNLTSQLVGFRIDNRGRVRAQGWIPKAGLSAEEFQLILYLVASEADCKGRLKSAAGGGRKVQHPVPM